jgi:hypothetical protein
MANLVLHYRLPPFPTRELAYVLFSFQIFQVVGWVATATQAVVVQTS